MKCGELNTTYIIILIIKVLKLGQQGAPALVKCIYNKGTPPPRMTELFTYTLGNFNLADTLAQTVVYGELLKIY